MKSNFNLISLLLVTFSLFISGCEKDNEDKNNNNNNQGSFKFLTLDGAKSLYISTSSKKSTSDELNKLYKVTEEGLVIEVAYLDENGDTLTRVESPSSIFNMSDNYILVRFQNGQQYLVRKSDGAVFDASSMPPVSSSQARYPDHEIQNDASGNIYYLGNDNNETNVIKLNITDPANIIVLRYSAASDQPHRFCVDNSGNMSYLGSTASFRYRHAEGGFINNPAGYICTDINNDSIITAKGPSSYMYGDPVKIQFLKIIPQPFGLINYGDSAIAWRTNDNNYGNSAVVTKMKNKNTIIAIYAGGIMEIQNPQRQPFILTYEYFGFTPLKNIVTLISSDNYYYMLGSVNQNDKPARLVKVNPDDNTFEAYNFSSEYEVYSINVSSDDVLSIYALRLMDGNRVLAKLDNGVITVLKVLDSETISSLVQIN